MNRLIVFLLGIATGILLLTMLDKLVDDQDNCKANMDEIIVQESLK